MAKQKVTQADIANVMNLSRNTVSRALNDEGGVSDYLKEKILQTAFEMGYKSAVPKQFTVQNKNIALVSFYNALNDSFWHPFVVGLEKVIRREGYGLTMCVFNEQDQELLQVPATLSSQVAGIVLIGLYSQQYVQRFLELKLPTVFVDCNVEIGIQNLVGDVIKMNNEQSTYELTKYLIQQKGCRKIGFYGDIVACSSYQERYLGFLRAMEEFHLPFHPKESLVFDTKGHYTSEMQFLHALNRIEYMPEAFVCCNDGRAVHLIMALKEMGYEIPEDVRVVGFDDQREAKIIDPPLTTIQCDRDALGKRTAEELFWRMRNPDCPYEIVTLPTKLIIRKSSE